MFKPHSVFRKEFGEGSRKIIVDTAEIDDGVFETMAMTPSGRELECRKSSSLDAASALHERMVKHYAEKAAEVKFTKKMTALVEALKVACAEASQVCNMSDDGGACNFDSPALFLPRWKQAEIEACAKEAGLGTYSWKSYSGKKWVFTVPHPCGQGDNRARMAEAMCKSLKNSGYDASMYYQMD